MIRMFPYLCACLCLCAGSAWPTGAKATRAADEVTPTTIAETVEAQPLRAQISRVMTGLEQLGAPLDPLVRAELERVGRDLTQPNASAEFQRLLDPLCFAFLRIRPDHNLEATAGIIRPELVEQGWRTFLIKVRNDAFSTDLLRIASPNARDLPGSPASEVGSRWMDLTTYTARPLAPRLSGLGVEYRLIQIYCKDAGVKTGTFQFTLERPNEPAVASAAANPASPEKIRKSVSVGKVIRSWQFDGGRGADGWVAANDCTLTAGDRGLVVQATGKDPFLTAPVKGPRGSYALRFWARSDREGVGQLFWRTTSRPQPDGAHWVAFPLQAGRAKEYTILFESEDELAGLRLDPVGGNAAPGNPGQLLLEWAVLIADPNALGTGATLTREFQSMPSSKVTFRVRDDKGQPAMACFEIRDAQGLVYPTPSKRLAPDFFFHPQIYRGDGESVNLPVGEYLILCSRGPESIPERKHLSIPRTIAKTETPVIVDYQVKRWVDPAARGWWSGDTHIHAAGCQHYDNPTQGVTPSDMIRHCWGEDLKVGCALTWGPCFDYQKQFFTAREDVASKPPYLLRYDIEVSGFGSHQSGHLVLLLLKEQIFPGGESKDHWPTLGLNTLRWAKRQGAITGPAHSAIGLTFTEKPLPNAPKPGPHRLPNYDIPRYDGIGANEFIVDVTHEVTGPDGRPTPAIDFISTMNTDRTAEWNMWYHVLNCGFRVKATGETDFPCVFGERVGMGRVYAKPEGAPDGWNYESYCKALARGRSYVSDGTTHLMDFQAETPAANNANGKTAVRQVGEGDGELHLQAPGNVTLSVQAAIRLPNSPDVKVACVVNGLTAAEVTAKADGVLRTLRWTVPVNRSSWVALRVFPHGHTNPIFVMVGDQPIRASRASALWCLEGVDQCWSQKQPLYDRSEHKDAMQAYDHARKVYRKIRDESATP